MPDLHDIGGSMGNIILQASYDGRLKSAEGFLSAAGDLCSLTAGSGKDLYLTAGKCVIFANVVSGNSFGDEVVLKVNGTIIETTKFNQTGGTGSGAIILDYKFENLFHKVSAGQILKIEVITLDTETDVEGFIQAIEVPTGENPTRYEGE